MGDGVSRVGGLVFETDVVGCEGPAVVARVEMIREGQDAPYQGVVNAVYNNERVPETNISYSCRCSASFDVQMRLVLSTLLRIEWVGYVHTRRHDSRLPNDMLAITAG